MIINNIFLNDGDIEKFFKIFNLAQKYYYTLNRFILSYKIIFEVK